LTDGIWYASLPTIHYPAERMIRRLQGSDMTGRIVTFYERALTTSVNDIEHIESQSIPNYGIIKIFFQPTVNINAALAEVSAMSQTCSAPSTSSMRSVCQSCSALAGIRRPEPVSFISRDRTA
jgi:multidrug efflux pump subunit AcrB